MLIPDPSTAAGDDAALELAVLEGLVAAVPLPPLGLPGWESLAAAEYARAAQGIAAALAAAAGALADARAAS